MDGWMDGWVGCGWMVDACMEERKDDLGSTVSAICNSRQSASKTRVQHKVIPREKTSLPAAPPLVVLGPPWWLHLIPSFAMGLGSGMQVGGWAEEPLTSWPSSLPPILQREYNFLECPQVLEGELITCNLPIKTSVAACWLGSQLLSAPPGSGWAGRPRCAGCGSSSASLEMPVLCRNSHDLWQSWPPRGPFQDGECSICLPYIPHAFIPSPQHAACYYYE